MNAFLLGREAGRYLLPPSLNPFADLDPRNADWERGRRETAAEQVHELDIERRRVQEAI